MNTAVIELNDVAVKVFRGGEVVASSPGFAVLREDQVELGQAALEVAHIDPRNTFSRFWSNLNQDGIKHKSKLVRHHADLAYAHLLSLHELAPEVEQVVLAVPGSFGTEQLALLLGLVEASPFTLVGLVDSAVAATAATAAPGRYEHLDMHLHHTVVTSLEVSDTVTRTVVKVVDDVGLLALQDKCVNHVADLFIRQSRFDPLHHAVTEQALCNLVTPCLRELARRNEAPVDIEFENVRYQARVQRERLVAALRPLYDKIGAVVEPGRIALAHPRLTGLPAFTERLTTISPRVDPLHPDAVCVGCMGCVQEDAGAGAGMYFITELPAATGTAPVVGAATGPAREQPPPPAAPTHVLTGADAHPLGPEPLYLTAQGVSSVAGAQPALCSLCLNGAGVTLSPSTNQSVHVNGQAVESTTALKPGDIIRFTHSDREFTLIRALERSGADGKPVPGQSRTSLSG